MIFKEAKTLVAENFSQDYFNLNKFILEEGNKANSRNGEINYVLNFKSELTNPIKRCVAGYGRNINVFFLMAESMWIFKGRRDLEFLEIFNKQMKEYSDDGKYFNAAYGWRLRKYDVDGLAIPEGSNLPYFDSGRDQLLDNLELLEKDSETRQAVCSLWNPNFDNPTVKTFDRACNCMLMYEIRGGELHQTIANRSNDLNWGLSVNVYQFSFLGEIISDILGIRYGTQTHNSKNLHIYKNTELTKELMITLQDDKNKFDLYDQFNNIPIQFTFKENNFTAREKLYWIDFYLHAIILRLLNRNKKLSLDKDETIFKTELFNFSSNFYYTYELLCIYVDYKEHKSKNLAIKDLLKLHLDNPASLAYTDIYLLSLNFFVRRVLDKDKSEYDKLMKEIISYIPSYKNIPLGYL